MREIEGMGHEVGYHYEVLGKAKRDQKRAIKMFEKEAHLCMDVIV
jgi:hypothetical protein